MVASSSRSTLVPRLSRPRSNTGLFSDGMELDKKHDGGEGEELGGRDEEWEQI